MFQYVNVKRIHKLITQVLPAYVNPLSAGKLHSTSKSSSINNMQIVVSLMYVGWLSFSGTFLKIIVYFLDDAIWKAVNPSFVI